MPAKAICDSDSWPDQPVITVTDMAQMAKPRTVAYSRCLDGSVTISGRTMAKARAAASVIRGSALTHRSRSRRAGTGRMRGTKARIASSGLPRLCT